MSFGEEAAAVYDDVSVRGDEAATVACLERLARGGPVLELAIGTGRIALPLARPGILSAAIFAFTLSWNEFIYALTLVSASSERTIPVGVLVQLSRADFYFWGPLMAGALLGSVPVAIVYSFFVDQYASGLTAGAVKG